MSSIKEKAACWVSCFLFPVMLACEQDTSPFPRTKQHHGHRYGDHGLDSWEKLQGILNALRVMQMGP